MNKNTIIREVTDHLPYSIFFTAAGIVLAGILTYISILVAGTPPESTNTHRPLPTGHAHEQHVADAAEAGDIRSACEHAPTGSAGVEAASGMLFHIFHPIHLLLSAMTTTAMFFRHEKRIGKAIAVGLIGSLGICGISDIFIPYLSGSLLRGFDIHFHWCLLKHPQMVLLFVTLGAVAGLLAAGTVHHSTVISHSAHVFISSTASLFYLISFGITGWYLGGTLGLVFIIVILSVTIPCCIGDVILPLCVARDENEDYDCCGHKH